MSNDPVDGGTVKYHRAEYVPDIEPRAPWKVWFTAPGEGTPRNFTKAEGEAMGLTPPEPAPLVVTCNGHSIEVDADEADAWSAYWERQGEPLGGYFTRTGHAFAGLLRDARQDPQPTADTPSDDIDFDALPIGTVLRTHNGYYVTKGGNGNWFDGEEAHAKPQPILAPYAVVHRPAPLSPGECLRGLLAGRDDADELIEYAKQWGGRGLTPDGRWRAAVGDAAREVHG